MALLAKSGVGHDINCHYYTPEEINLAIQRPVVQLLFELICFRHSDPAFDGSFSLPETNDTKIAIRWIKDKIGLCWRSILISVHIVYQVARLLRRAQREWNWQVCGLII